ncbi:MAG: FAD:protein FMN transferase [Longimicrobiales bacterium]
MCARSDLRFATAAMGTRFEIVIETAAAESQHDVHWRAVGEAAIAEIERLHRQLSFFAKDSLVSHINRTALSAPVRLDVDTFSLLQDAQAVWRLSDGAFDVTRGSGMDRVILDENARTVSFGCDGISIDLGGIAKGHAVDRAAAILREHGVTRALVHGGTSSVAAVGSPAGSPQGWTIALAPSGTTVTLSDETLSVSSGAMREHIVDPSTGAFIKGPRIAAVTGPSARLGDAWSTAVAVLGARPARMDSEWQTIIEAYD